MPCVADYTPSPNKYDTSRDAIWQNGAVTMKRKDVTWPYDTRSNSVLILHWFVLSSNLNYSVHFQRTPM